MTDGAVEAPRPTRGRRRWPSLTFALLLLDETVNVREANPAAEDLLGAGARRMVGQSLRDLLVFGDDLIAERIAERDAQLTARGVPVRFGERDTPCER